MIIIACRLFFKCILKNKGGNQLVKKRRGKLFHDAIIIDLTIDNEEDSNMVAIVNIPIVLDYEESDGKSVSSL